jgi:Ca2+/Na+ antiporter
MSLVTNIGWTYIIAAIMFYCVVAFVFMYYKAKQPIPVVYEYKEFYKTNVVTKTLNYILGFVMLGIPVVVFVMIMSFIWGF